MGGWEKSIWEGVHGKGPKSKLLGTDSILKGKERRGLISLEEKLFGLNGLHISITQKQTMLKKRTVGALSESGVLGENGHAWEKK